MENSRIDRLVKRIETMKFEFLTDNIGHPIDRNTMEVHHIEQLSDEESVMLNIQIQGEMGPRFITGTEAAEIYNLIWKSINNQESQTEK